VSQCAACGECPATVWCLQVLVFDMGVPVRLAFFALVEHESVAAPLWDSSRGSFAGMITVTDFIQMMLQYHRAGDAAEALSGNTLAAWKSEQASRMAEQLTGARSHVDDDVPMEDTAGHFAPDSLESGEASVVPFPVGLVSIHPDASLLDACSLLRRHRIHRLAVIPREEDWSTLGAGAACDKPSSTAVAAGDPLFKHSDLHRQCKKLATTSPVRESAVLPNWAASPDAGARLLIAAGMLDPPTRPPVGLSPAGDEIRLPPSVGRKVTSSRREGRLEEAPAPATVLGILTHTVLFHTLIERLSLLASHPDEEHPLWDLSSSLFSDPIVSSGVGTWERRASPSFRARVVPSLVVSSCDAPLVEVLSLMARHRVSCVPLVDKGGRFMDVWGREDVLFLATDPSLAMLSKPVKEVRAAQIHASGGVHSVRVCAPLDSVRRVLDIFAATRIQRLVAVDAAAQPVGVVTLADVFSRFVDELSPSPSPPLGEEEAVVAVADDEDLDMG
jgi:CBS domain-containing protein